MQNATPAVRLATIKMPATAMAGTRYTNDARLNTLVSPNARPPRPASIASGVSAMTTCAMSPRQRIARAGERKRACRGAAAADGLIAGMGMVSPAEGDSVPRAGDDSVSPAEGDTASPTKGDTASPTKGDTASSA